MKAIVYEKFGSPDVLFMKEIEKPKPKENEVLLKIHATSLNAYDWRHIRADPFLIRLMGGGLFKPKHPVLGADIAGIVEETGSNVSRFKIGDEIFGEGGYGGLAEYVCVDAVKFVTKPSQISFEEAAAAPMAGLTALQALRDSGKIKTGQKVLINGASGGVGSYAVQLAKWFGTEVTAVCSTSKMEFTRQIGADYVVDYTKEDITQKGRKFDLILDIAAYRSSSDYKKIMNPGARYFIAGGSVKRLIGLMFKSMFGNKNMGTMVAKVNEADLLIIKELLAKGKIKSFVHKIYPLEKTAEAVKFLEEGHVKGKVVIKII